MIKWTYQTIYQYLLVAFVVIGWCVIVDVRVASPSAKWWRNAWSAPRRPIGSYRENAIANESEAGDSLTSIDQSGFARKERNVHCDVLVTYPSPLKTNTYYRRLGRQTLSGWRDRSDPGVPIKAYTSQSYLYDCESPITHQLAGVSCYNKSS